MADKSKLKPGDSIFTIEFCTWRRHDRFEIYSWVVERVGRFVWAKRGFLKRFQKGEWYATHKEAEDVAYQHLADVDGQSMAVSELENLIHTTRYSAATLQQVIFFLKNSKTQ